MALENTVAKYEIQIARTGSGATEAASQFKAVEAAAKTAKTETENASSALEELHSSSLLGRDGLHAFNAVALITGSERMPLVREAVMGAHGTLNLLQKSAAATGTSLTAMAGAVLAAAAAVATAITGWQALKAKQEEARSEEELVQATISNTNRLLKLIDEYQAKGILSTDYWSKLRTQLVEFTSEGLSAAQHSLMASGYSGASIAALEKFETLQKKIHEEALSNFENERTKAADIYNERMNQISKLATASKLITPEKKDAAESEAAKVYSASVQVSLDKESEAKFKEAMSALEDEITIDEKTYGTTRKGLAESEFEARLAIAKKYLANVATQEGNLTAYTKAQLDISKKYAEAQAAAAKAEDEAMASQSVEIVKQYDSQFKIEALKSKDDQVTIAKREYSERVALYDDLYNAGILSIDQLNDYMASALEKELTTIKSYENKESIHVKTIGQMASSAAETFASDFSSAFADFADGTKTAEEAFTDFAKSFLKSIASMILQQSILNALKAASSALGLSSGGTKSSSSGASTAVYSDNTMVSESAMALGGVRWAASGLSGVGSVSSPTYFPKFNVVAGEAGREMLTVLAKPRMMSFGGVEAVVGDAGKNQLAIANANDLAKSQGNGTASGKIQIEISHSEESKVNIINSSIQGAETRIIQQATRNTKLRTAIKRGVGS